MKKQQLLIFIFFFLFSTICTAQTLPSQPVRGVWLTNVASDALNSRENIIQTVKTCKVSGINTIFVVVLNRGVTMYPSKIMEKEFGIAIDPAYKGRDPLQELIEEADKEHIPVHAWFEFGFTSAYQNEGSAILQKHPEWTAIDQKGNPVVKNDFHWMNAFLPQVQHFIQSLVVEVVKHYKVTGVQGDDRLPATPVEAGYDTYTQNLFRKTFHKDPPLNTKDSMWVQWRADVLTSFQKRLYNAVKKINPNVLVTTAPNLYPWAKEEYLQDWPSWVKNQCTDLVFVQLYRYKLQDYERILDEMIAQAGKNKSKVYPGILLNLGDGYTASDTLLKGFIDLNRKKGIHGEVFFYYEGLKQHTKYFQQVYPKS